jgi:carboxyl-terminal processing protease
MMLKNLFCLVLATLFVSLNFSYGFCARGRSQDDELYANIELFTDALTIIQSEYVEEVEAKDLIYGALKGMLSSLDDYSQFLDPDAYKEIKVETEGKFGGLGIEITIKNGLLTIISPIDDTPAHRAGLKAGDKIVKIEGELTKDITLMEAVKKLRGKPGTKIDITVLREGEEKLLDFTITRDIIKIESVKEAKVLEDKIGYIRLANFTEDTPREFEKALVSLEKEGLEGLVLDLRNNPGGLLNVAVETADKFILAGNVIVSTKGRNPEQIIEFKSHGRNTHPSYPLVVLVNEGSASGSEIVAGAIQDHRRGVILGTQTFGKGSVQTIIPLKDGSALRLTTSKYFTPSGRAIHGTGITPDVIVQQQEIKIEPKKEQPEEIFDKIERGEAQLGKDSADEFAKDYQLIRAVDLIKAIRVYKQLNIEAGS